MILVGAGVENSGTITPDSRNYTYYSTATNSIILRWGLESAFLLVLFLGQFLFKKLIW